MKGVIRRFGALLICLTLVGALLAGCGNNGGSGNNNNNGTKTFKVTFETNGGSSVAAQDVAENGFAKKPADPTKDGFIFGGWAKDASGSTVFNFESDAITANITLYAVWNDASNASTATFHLNYEGADVYRSNAYANDTRIAKPENPTREGYVFAGWYEDTNLSEEFSDMKKYSGNVDFYAKWLKAYALEAELTQLSGLDPETDITATTSGNKIGYGRSGEVSGKDMISKDSNCSGGAFVRGLYYTDAYLQFEIECDADVTDARLTARLAAEFKDYSLTSDDLAFEVNGKELKYNTKIELKQDAPFSDFVISTTVSLKKGSNIIRLVVKNDEKQFGDGTVNAAAPMVDCLYLYTTAGITMKTY